jgi:uncharacterized protein (TIGR02001 family)
MNRKHTFKAAGRNDLWFSGVCIAALIVIGVAGQARAQEVVGPRVSWNVALTSDYVFRGVSQTQENPAISAGVDATFGDFYAGGWASNVDFGDDTDAEVDLYGGWRSELSGWSVDLGGVTYLYTGQPDGADYDYVELKAAATRALGPVTVGGAVYWSPDFFGASEDEATYVEANAAFTQADRWTVSGAVGRQWVSSDLDYTTWNLGAAFALTDHLTVDLRYHDTDQHDFGEAYGARAVASLKAAF